MHRALTALLVLGLYSHVDAATTFLVNVTNSSVPWNGPPFISTCRDDPGYSYIAFENGVQPNPPGVTAANKLNVAYSLSQGGYTPTGANAYIAWSAAVQDVTYWKTVIVSSWIKWTGTTSSATYWPIMQLGYSDSALGTGLQLFASGIANTNTMTLCVMFNAVNNPGTCGGSGKYISSTPITTWPSPKSATGWTHVSWMASGYYAGVSVYQLYVNGELIQTQNIPPGTTSIPSFFSIYNGIGSNQMGFNFGTSATSPMLSNFWAGHLYLSVNAGYNADPELVGATGLYYGTQCYGSVYDAFSLRTDPLIGANYLSYNQPANVTTIVGAMPASAFSSIGPPLVAGSLVPVQCASGAPTTTPPCGFGFALNTATSYVQVGGPLDWGFRGPLNTGHPWNTNQVNIDYTLSNDLATSSSRNHGFTVATWIYRTSATSTVGKMTRLFTVVPDNAIPSAGSYVITLYDVNVGPTTYAGAATSTNSGHAVSLTWPGCAAAYFYSPLITASLDIRGPHIVVVSYDENSGVAVYVDGIQYTYRASNSSVPYGECDLAFSTWPEHMLKSIAYIGNYNNSSPNVVYNILETTLYSFSMTSADVLSISSIGTSLVSNWPAPPPPTYNAPSSTLQSMPRYAACASAQPIHRYGSATYSPFDGGIMKDIGAQGQTTPWPGMWNFGYGTVPLPTTQLAQSTITLSLTGGLYANAARVDFGVRAFSGVGLTIGFLMDWSGVTECTVTSATATAVAIGIPSPITYFDFGGYSMYTVAANCVPGVTGGVPNVVTKVTNPVGASGTYVGIGAAGSANYIVPQQLQRYTFVVFSTAGTTVYVNGAVWAVFPTVAYDTSVTPWISRNTRFFGGNLAATSMTIHDLQIYDRPLSALDVMSLSKGMENQC